MNFKNLKSISKKLQTIWKSVYIVGWWCRENILWNKNYNWDIDLTTDALPFEIEKVLNVIKEVGKKYWTLIIKEWNEVFEITTFRSDIWILNNRKPVKVVFSNNLDLDSKRRDFTLNSIYYDIKNELFIDPENGINDIKNHVIRFVWDIKDRVEEDALRILRFVRIKNKYDFKIANENYFEILKNNVKLLKNISIERIKDEFDKILLLENNINALNDLKNIWFFKEIIPEIDNLAKTPWWPKHHLEWDVWTHTLMTIDQLNKMGFGLTPPKDI
jgi:tRNA nucleotidyltransferase (CCA-adding enzyme)